MGSSLFYILRSVLSHFTQERRIMWQEGRFEIDGNGFWYKVKVWPVDILGGLNGSRVVKVCLANNRDDRNRMIFDPVAYYDGGWEIKPKNSIGKKALEHLLGLFGVKERL